MKVLFVGLLLLVGAEPGVSGEDTGAVTARLIADTVSVGEEAELKIEVTGECAVDAELPPFPEISGLEFRLISGPDFAIRSATSGGGGSLHIAEYVVGIRPTKPGEYAIIGLGAICLSAELIRANRVDLTAVSNTTRIAPVRLSVFPGKEEVYEREPFSVGLKLEIDARIQNTLTSGSCQLVFPWWDDVFVLSRRDSLVRGKGDQRVFPIADANRSVYLNRTGKKIERRGVFFDEYSGAIRVQAPEPGTLSFAGSAFVYSLPEGAGLSASVRRVVADRFRAEAPGRFIEVVAVPEEGRPSDYGGAVGHFMIEVESDRSAVQVGDPLEIRIRVSEARPSRSNLATANFPGLDFIEGFRVYAREAWSEPDARLWRYELSPADTSVEEIPPFQITWFDPLTGSFVSASSPAIPLDVSPHPGGRELKQDDEAASSDSPDVLSHLLALAVGVALALVLVAGAGRWRRRSASTVQKPLHSQAIDRLQEDLGRLRDGDDRDPLDEGRILARYIADRFNSEPGRCFGASSDEVLEEAGIGAETRRDVRLYFESLARAVFSHEQTGVEQSGDSPVELLARRIEEEA